MYIFKNFYLAAVVDERNLLSCFNMNWARFNSKSVEIFANYVII